MTNRTIKFLTILSVLCLFRPASVAQIWEVANGTHHSTRIVAAGGSHLFSVSSRLFFSSNFGSTWQVDNGVASNNITGFAIGGTGLYYFSSPLGIFSSPAFSDLNNENWGRIDSTNIPLVTSLLVTNSEIPNVDAIYVGSTSGLRRRNSSSGTWTILHDAGDAVPIKSIAVYHSNIYYATQHDAYASYDNGTTWRNIHSVPGNFSISSIVATSDSDIFLCITSVKSDILHSSHRGADDWSGFKSLNLGDATFNTLVANADGDLYLGGSFHDPSNADSATQGIVWQFLHDDSQWRSFSDGLPVSNVIGLGFSTSGKVYAGTDSSGLWRTVLPSKVTASSELRGIWLSQGFPNPATVSTEFNLNLDHRATVTLALFDALGRQVRIITSELLEQGTHSFTADVRSLPSGNYFCRLQTPEGSITKNFVVSH